MKRFYFKNRKLISFFVLAVFATGIFLIPERCLAAGAGEWVENALTGSIAWVVGGIAQLIVKTGGIIITFTMDLVVQIAQYNDFIKETGIVSAWVIIRDFCNMLFILILLIIAFATILRQDNYSVKKLLPKLLMMAVLINFSRTIVGIMIDASQIVMLTFVSTFADAKGNFVSMLKITEMLSFIQHSDGVAITLNDVAVASILAVLFIAVAAIAMLAILAVFAMRMVMLWILVTLSPLAFLLMVFPGGQKYASQYWGKLNTYLINGPILAFFIWLSLATLNQFNAKVFTTSVTDVSAATASFEGGNYMSFVLAIAFLIGGLMISSEIGGLGASWGFNMVNNLRSRGMNLGGRIARSPFALGQRALGAAGRGSAAYLAGGDEGGTRAGIRGMLGRVGGRQIPFLSNMATNTVLGMNSTRNTLQQNALQRATQIAGTHDRNLIRGTMNRLSRHVSPQAEMTRDILEELAPTQARDMAASLRRSATNGRLQNIPRNEWERIGQEMAAGRLDIFTNPNMAGVHDFLQTNAGARGHVNRGAANAGSVTTIGGVNYRGGQYGTRNLLGRDAQGNNLTNVSLANDIIRRARLGTAYAAGNALHDAELTRVMQGSGDTRFGVYEATNTAFDAAILSAGTARTIGTAPATTPTPNYYSTRNKSGSARGTGNLSVNRFSRGQDNTIALDFDQLPSDIFNYKPSTIGLHQVEGVNINDQDKLKAISGSMSKMLGEKIAAGGSAKQLEMYKNAKLKFDGIASGQVKLDNMSLVNSAAEGYGSAKNAKRVKIHEELHGFGARDNSNMAQAENYVDVETEKMMEKGKYSHRSQVGSSYGLADAVGLGDSDAPAHSSAFGYSGGGGDNNQLVQALKSLTAQMGNVTKGFNKIGDNLGENLTNLNKTVENTTKNMADIAFKNKQQNKALRDVGEAQVVASEATNKKLEESNIKKS